MPIKFNVVKKLKKPAKKKFEGKFKVKEKAEPKPAKKKMQFKVKAKEPRTLGKDLTGLSHTQMKALSTMDLLKLLPQELKDKVGKEHKKMEGDIYSFDANRPRLPKVISIEGGGRVRIVGDIEVKVVIGDKKVKMTLVNKDYRFRGKTLPKVKEMVKSKFLGLVKEGLITNVREMKEWQDEMEKGMKAWHIVEKEMKPLTEARRARWHTPLWPYDKAPQDYYEYGKAREQYSKDFKTDFESVMATKDKQFNQSVRNMRSFLKARGLL
tara:strand:+ start:117 stop:917 length:801 start_codon:yes stop_codon:yes gene_type:complete